MSEFKEHHIFLDVEGYSLNYNQLERFSSSPLFSWRKLRKGYSNLHWGFQEIQNASRSFWLTELCLVKGQDYHRHYIPGAYLKPKRYTEASRTFSYVWNYMHDRYTFRWKDIEDQCYVEEYLLDKITPDTVVFYKGGHYEKMIGELCGAKTVNIETLGVSGSAEIPEPLVRGAECKVHWKNLHHCPLQEVQYFMNMIEEWLPNYKEHSNDEEHPNNEEHEDMIVVVE